MTACVNNQNENKGGVSHKVLRSVVAGVMAVSMVPSVALAETAATESEDVSLLSVEPGKDFSQGEITAAVDNNEGTLDLSDSVEWVVDNKAHYVIPTCVKTSENTNIQLEVAETQTETSNNKIQLVEKGNENNKFELTIQADVNGKPSGTALAPTSVTSIGTYYAVVTPTAGDWFNANTPAYSVSLKFAIVAKSLKGAQLFEVGEAGDYSDTDFVFNNKAYTFGDQKGNLGVVLDGEALAATTQYSVKIFKDGSATAETGTTPTYAGKYTAVITGVGTEYAGSEVKIPFEVKQFDLSTAKVELTSATQKEGQTTEPEIASIEGFTPESSKDITDYFTLAFKSSSNGDSFVQDPGTYTYTVKLNSQDENLKASVTGTQDVTFDVLTKDSTSVSQSNAFLGKEKLEASYSIDYSAGDKAFDLNDIYVKVGDTKLSGSQLDITVTDAKGNAGDVTKPGVWNVTVNVVPSKCDYKFSGSASTTVTVTNGTIDADSELYFKFDNKVVAQSKEVTYDGTDQLDKLQVVVKTDDGEKVLTEGTDYKVEVKAGNKVVTEAVNADTYVVTVTSDSWNGFTSQTLNLVVNPVNPTMIRVAGLKTVYGPDATDITGIPYTGSEITPTFEYTIDSSDAINKGTAEWKTLPADAYDLRIEKGGKVVECKDAQEYHANITAAATEMAGNFNLTGYSSKFIGGSTNAGNFFVINDTCFDDVKASDWYATAATMGKKLEYFAGVEGGLFLPAKTLTRAEAVQVLYAMSGAHIAWSDYAKYKQIADEAFGDVSEGAWYAVQLGWAKEAGLVSGDDQGNFNAGQEINREQFAVMLANYASKFGTYKAADTKVLADYADADSISSWAEAAVAWAVENEVMGANDTLTPQATISRAETATMVVNYQPKQR